MCISHDARQGVLKWPAHMKPAFRLWLKGNFGGFFNLGPIFFLSFWVQTLTEDNISDQNRSRVITLKPANTKWQVNMRQVSGKHKRLTLLSLLERIPLYSRYAVASFSVLAQYWTITILQLQLQYM